MNAKQIADALNGTQYPLTLTRESEAELKAAGLIVIVGHSDDLIVSHGYTSDEAGAYDGTTAYLSGNGFLQSREGLDLDTDEELEQWLDQKSQSKPIIADFDACGYTWRLTTPVKHESFELYEGEEKHTKGLVIHIQDLIEFDPRGL